MTETSKNIKLIKPLLRGLPAIAAAVFICVWIASWYLSHTTPMYESMAKIKLADPNEGATSANLYKDFDVFSNTNKISTEVEMLKSKVLVSKALDSIDMQTMIYRVGKVLKKELYNDAPFRPVIEIKNKSWYGRTFQLTIHSANTFTISLPSGKKLTGTFNTPLLDKEADIILMRNDVLLKDKPNLTLADAYEIIVNNREKSVEQIISKLDVTSVDKDVPILRIIYSSPVPEKAADFVNVLAQTYVEDYVESRYKAANITVKFLNKQLDDIGKKLSNSENTIEDFRDAENIINIRQETETDLRKIAQLKIQLANLSMNLAAIDTLNLYIQSGKNFLELAPNFEAFTDLLSTELVKKIKQLQSDRSDLLIRYTENDEKVKVIDQKLNDITSYLKESILNTRKNYEIKYLEIDRAIKDAEQVFVGLPTREKQMAIFERNFTLNEKIYNFLHQKRTEAEIARAATVSFHRIIAKGEVPARPVSPNKAIILGVSVILGLLSSISLIYTIHSMKAKVNDLSAIEKNSETPVAGEVLMLQKDKDRIAFFNALATRLNVKKVLQFPSVITISSFDRNEGKSYNSLWLAKGIASLEKKVLLVEAGTDKIQKQLYPHHSPAAASIHPAGHERIDYYKAAEETTNNVIIRESLEQKINNWKQSYDCIIIRNENCSQSANALVFMSAASINLFVLDSRKTALKKVMEADILKEEMHVPNMYFLLNRAHYNPSILVESWELISKLYGTTKKLLIRK